MLSASRSAPATAAGGLDVCEGALYARTAHYAARDAGFAAADVIVHLVETARENWSFGEGVAHYAPAAS